MTVSYLGVKLTKLFLDKCFPNITKKKKSDNLKIEKKNFYLDYIQNEFNIKNKFLDKKISTYQCEKCKCLINRTWFDEYHVRKIYSSVYGQHHKGWIKFIDFIKSAFYNFFTHE